MKTSTLTIRLDKDLDDLLTKVSRRSRRKCGELARVLRSKFGISQDLIDDYIRLLRQDGVPAEPSDVLRVGLRDKVMILIPFSRRCVRPMHRRESSWTWRDVIFPPHE